MQLIENKKDKLEELCRKYRVAELDVFGSAATGDFDQRQSDIDFLVEFDSEVGKNRFDNFFGLLDELKQLFGRDIDLVEPGGLRNPYFKQMVDKTRKKVYAAS
jgi:hypothetical protein